MTIHLLHVVAAISGWRSVEWSNADRTPCLSNAQTLVGALVIATCLSKKWMVLPGIASRTFTEMLCTIPGKKEVFSALMLYAGARITANELAPWKKQEGSQVTLQTRMKRLAALISVSFFMYKIAKQITKENTLSLIASAKHLLFHRASTGKYLIYSPSTENPLHQKM